MKFIEKFKIQNKLFILIIAFSIGFMLFGITSALTLNKTRVNGSMYKSIIQGKDIVADILPPPEYIIESYLTVLEIFQESESSSPDSTAKIDALIQYGNNLKETYEQRHSYWMNELKDGELKKLLTEDSYQYAEEFYKIRDTKFIPAVQSKDSAKINQYCEELKSVYAKHREVIDKLVVSTNAYNASIEKKADTTILLSIAGLIIIIIILIAIICTLFYKISRSITKPILYISDTMQKISYGDLSVKVDENYITNDEIGDLCKAAKATTALLNKYLDYITEITITLNTISEGNLDFTLKNDYYGEFKAIKDALIKISASLSEMLQHIDETSDQVTIHSKDIAESAAFMASGAAEQAAAIEQILASITEISALAKNSSLDAENALNAYRLCKIEVKNGDEKMFKLQEAITDISTTSEEVYKIMDTIKAIASKTSLLAINASIEATRSNDSGSGFVVIADEIRKLSLQTTEATATIEGLISNSIAAANSGTYWAKDTAESLKTIVNETNHSTLFTDKISEGCTSQSAALTELSAAIEDISKVVQQTAALAEESTSVSDLLYSQAEALKHMIEKFKFRTV